MKSILCFGDSNTWGYNPHTKERYSRNERWTGVLRQELGDGYEIIEGWKTDRVCRDVRRCRSEIRQVLPTSETNCKRSRV